MTDQKTIDLLQKLGLTFYGAKAYATLMTTGTATPSILATEAEIPRSRIYEVIQRLEEQKWVTVEKGRPQWGHTPLSTRSHERAEVPAELGHR